MSMLARAVATCAGLLIGATTVSYVPSNEWWIRVLDFPRLQIAVDVAWSRTSRRLQQTAALRDLRVGRGLFATFNVNLPAGFRWPLDHVFVSDDFALCTLERPGDIGSDHFPLLVDVLLQREGSHP